MTYTGAVNENVRLAIKKAMKERNVTQQELADHLGVTQPMIAQYLSGYRGNLPETFQKLLEYLGLELIVKEKL